VTTADVADATGISRDSARRKLETLRDRERVERRQTAGRVMLYWPGDGPMPSEGRETGERGEQTADTRDTRTDTAGETRAASDATLSALVDTVGRDVLPGCGTKLDERTDALRAVVKHLQDHGTATPSDFQSDVYPEHPARYTDGKDPAYSWWKNAMLPALSELAEHTDEIEKADQSGEWAYVGGPDADDQDTDPLDTTGPYDPTDEFDA